MRELSCAPIMSTGAQATQTGEDAQLWTVRGLIADHKAAALVAAAACALMLAIALFAIFGAKAGAVSDRTTCTSWGSANQNQQNAYARLYLREHGPVRGVGSTPTSVIDAINIECLEAYNEDVSDSTSVVQAISGHF